MENGPNDLICNQTKIPREQWRYGLRSSAAVGCGWIAVYNALRLMGYQADPDRLIRWFEGRLPLFNGNFGTFVLDPAAFFRQQGFAVQVTARRETFDETAKHHDVCILYYYWREKYKIGCHFTTVQYRNGRFTGCNTFRNSEGPDDLGESLEAFIRRQNYFGCVLTAIRNRHGHS